MYLPRLAEWRWRRALSQREVATRAGLAAATVNRVENGLQPARPSTVRKLADALGVTPDDLMGPDVLRASFNGKD